MGIRKWYSSASFFQVILWSPKWRSLKTPNRATRKNLAIRNVHSNLAKIRYTREILHATWQITHFKRQIIFQTSLFGFHVYCPIACIRGVIWSFIAVGPPHQTLNMASNFWLLQPQSWDFLGVFNIISCISLPFLYLTKRHEFAPKNTSIKKQSGNVGRFPKNNQWDDCWGDVRYC